MEIGQLRKEINDLLENIVEHSNNYSNNRPIPSLEVSYVLKKVSRMQESLIILKHLLEREELRIKQSRTSASQPIPAAKPIAADPAMEATVPVESSMLESVPPPIPAEAQEEAILPEEPVVEEPVSLDEPEVKSISETEQPAQVPTRSSLENRPIARLIDALTLNDRYLYANELFNKDMTAFNELVKALDNCTNKEEAQGIIAGYDEQWDQENVHVLSFFDLVDRRFTAS